MTWGIVNNHHNWTPILVSLQLSNIVASKTVRFPFEKILLNVMVHEAMGTNTSNNVNISTLSTRLKLRYIAYHLENAYLSRKYED